MAPRFQGAADDIQNRPLIINDEDVGHLRTSQAGKRGSAPRCDLPGSEMKYSLGKRNRQPNGRARRARGACLTRASYPNLRRGHLTGIIKCAYGVPANITYGTFVFAAVVG